MKYAIQINASPYASYAGRSAYRFILAAIDAGHQVDQVFFYQEGIGHALRYASPPDDEQNLTRQWSALAKDYGIDLLVCISAAQRRGLLCADEAKRQGAKDNDLADGFRIGGLGQWLETTLNADRCLVFG
ncbi:MAG: sulfurtransferase complex subunit TusD [Gammaproteobacteria bacterium]